MTQAEFIATIKPLVPHSRCASNDALALVTEAISTFPECAELWFLQGQVTMTSTEGEVADIARRSFEMALLFDPSLVAAAEALQQYKSAQTSGE